MKTTIPTAILSLSFALLIGCSAQQTVKPSASASSASVAPALSGADAYRQLTDYSAIGLHRTGTDGGERTVQWLTARLSSMNLQAQIEPFEFNQYIPTNAALKLDDGSSVKVFPYWYSGRTTANGLNAELIDVGSGTQAEFDGKKVSGKLVLADIKLKLRAFFPTLNDVMRRAHAAGAIGVVAVAQGAPDNLIVAANAESEAGLCGLPVLFAGAEDGVHIRQRAGKSVTFVLDADYRVGKSANVIATIPGKSSDTIMIGTPTNGWFTTASERGAGVGTLLTLARYYADRAQSGAPPAKTLVFVFTGGHEVGYLGLNRYIDAHPDVIAKTYSYVHLGASIAGTFYFKKPDGSTDSAPIADPARILFVSENPLLQKMVSARQLSNELFPAQTILPSVLNPGEQRSMYAKGVPIISMSGTTLYFHTEADTAETSSAQLLEPTVKFYGSVIEDLLAVTSATVLSNNALAASYAKTLPPPVCVVPGN